MDDDITFLLIDSLCMADISLQTNSRTWGHTDKQVSRIFVLIAVLIYATCCELKS